MNPTDPNRRGLLDDLLFDQERAAAPSLAALLKTIDREKRRRLRRGRAIVATAFSMFAAGFLSFTFSGHLTHRYARKDSSAPAIRVSLPAGTAEPFKVARINDEELQALLAETPSALVQWEDGRRAVMLVVQTPGGD